MDDNTSKIGFLDNLWEFFASLRLTITLLFSLAITSIVGTLIPQNESPEAYIRAYGDFLYRVFSVFDLFDMYHSWWFQLFIVMLVVNIIVCSLNRFSGTLKIVLNRDPKYSISRFRKMTGREGFITDQPREYLRKNYTAFIKGRFGRLKTEDTEDGFYIFGERGRWSRIGVYLVHLSVVLLLVGGLTGSLLGFEAYVSIPEGESGQNVSLRNSALSHKLDFEIRCDDFDISFYKTGMVKEFRSSLTIVENGKEVVKKDIIVNDPLRYRGITIYQSAWGELPPEMRAVKGPPEGKIILNFTSKATGMQYQKEAAIGSSVDLPEGAGKLNIAGYTKAATFMGKNIGEALSGKLTKNDGTTTDILLSMRFSKFDRMRNGDMVISVSDRKLSDDSDSGDSVRKLMEKRYYTVLGLTKDPGVWIVYSGFLLMVIGCYVTFFVSHQTICVEVVKKGSKNGVVVSGTANKNKIGLENKIKRLSQELMKK